MNVKVFVSSSAAVLAAWLFVTYVREVPGESYPQLGRGSEPLTSTAPSVPNSADAVGLPELAKTEVDFSGE